MLLVTSIIIYFAIGVPFGVLAAALVRGHVHTRDVLNVVYNLTFWPLILLKDHIRWPKYTSEPENRSTSKLSFEERTIRRRLISEIEILNGLRHARHDLIESPGDRIPFIDIIGHPNPRLAAKCVQRSNLAKLERHISAAEDRIRSTVSISNTAKKEISAVLTQIDDIDLGNFSIEMNRS
jgi:hypothetical protein